LVTKAEEQQALGVLEAMEFHTITMHGRTARRTVRHFGLDYGYESWKLVATDPLPDDLAWLQARAAVLAGLDPGEFAQILVSRYPPGSTIGWHRDAPMFGAKVVGISLASTCRMRF
jgi:DNA oxidative demethylase